MAYIFVMVQGFHMRLHEVPGGTNTSGGCWVKACSVYHLYKRVGAWSRPHRARLPSTTKMLVPLFALLASSLLAVESALSRGTCPRDEWGTEAIEESWECNNGASSCFSSIDTCSNDGSFRGVAGSTNYDANGNGLPSTGGGWDCRHIYLYVIP